MDEKLKPLTGQEAFNELVDHLMGKNYYIVDPVGCHQANALILEEVKRAYPRPLKNRMFAVIGNRLKYLSESIH